jgi:tetratricopeptide (TPR) repeat protein
MLKTLNNLGQYAQVLEYEKQSEETRSRLKFSWQEALVEKEIARAYKATGNFEKARAVLSKALKSCAEEIPDNTCSDKLELTSLRLCHTRQLDQIMLSEAHNYLNAFKRSKSWKRYFGAVPKVLGVLTESAVNTTSEWDTIDQEISNYEKTGEPLIEIMELRLTEGAAARKRQADPAEENKYYLSAIVQSKREPESFRMNCLLLFLYARAMDTMARVSSPDYASIDKLHDAAQVYESGAAPFDFVNRDYYMRAKLGSAAEQSLNIREKMLSKNAANEMVVAIPDYANCAATLSDDYIKRGEKEKAYSVLRECERTLRKYRPTSYADMAFIYSHLANLISSDSTKAALKIHYDELEAKAKANAQMLDFDEVGWEPYHFWTRR